MLSRATIGVLGWHEPLTVMVGVFRTSSELTVAVFFEEEDGTVCCELELFLVTVDDEEFIVLPELLTEGELVPEPLPWLRLPCWPPWLPESLSEDSMPGLSMPLELLSE
jgi:hypothetical protein